MELFKKAGTSVPRYHFCKNALLKCFSSSLNGRVVGVLVRDEEGGLGCAAVGVDVVLGEDALVDGHVGAGDGAVKRHGDHLRADILFLKHACSILRLSSSPVCGFSMMKQFCSVWPTENWPGPSMNHIQVG